MPKKAKKEEKAEEVAAPLMRNDELEEARATTEAERTARLAADVAAINEMEEGLPKPIIGMLFIRFCAIMCIGIILFFVLFFVLLWAKNNSGGCGINVWTWLMVFVSLITLGTLILCPILLCCMKENPLKAISWTLCLLTTFCVVIAGWVIYGYVIYFSDSNDCQSSYDTSVALVFMCIFLILGCFCICCAVGCLIATPVLFFGSIRPMLVDNERKKDTFANFQKAMKFGFTQLKVSSDRMGLLQDDCVICLDGYNEDKHAVKLKCGHVFHSACIIAWVDSGKFNCPVCRKTIKWAKKEDEANEGGDNEDDSLISKNKRE